VSPAAAAAAAVVFGRVWYLITTPADKAWRSLAQPVSPHLVHNHTLTP